MSKTKSAVQPKAPLNLATKAGIAEIQRKSDNIDEVEVDSINIHQYLKGETSPVEYAGQPIVYCNGNLSYIDNNGLIYITDYEELLDFEPNGELAGVIISRKPLAGYKRFVVANGDESEDGIESDHLVIEVSDTFPTLSFNCLTRLFNPKLSRQEDVSPDDIEKCVLALAGGNLKLLDFYSDKSVDLTTAELKAYNNDKTKLTPPERGFTLIGRCWHMSAIVLIHNTAKEKYYLLGQDDGSYFGVELAAPAKTIEKAYTGLRPKGVPADAKRQGEWFVVPKKEDAVPAIEDCLATSDCHMILPREGKESNKHEIKDSEIRVGSDGKIYARGGSIEHDEHPEINLGAGWVTFLKNTAVRSVSVKGVD